MGEYIKSPWKRRIDADLQRIKILETELAEIRKHIGKLETELVKIREYENYIKSEICFLSNRIKEAESKENSEG